MAPSSQELEPPANPERFSFTPYIVGNSDPAFNKIPDHHQDRLRGLKAYWEKEAQKREDEKKAGLEKADPGDDENERRALGNVMRELEKAQSPAASPNAAQDAPSKDPT